MPLVKLKFRPGIDTEGTDYENTVGWTDSNKVRFRKGLPENIGGWSPYSDNTFVGTCRSLIPWTAFDGTNYIGMGTSKKLYVDRGTTYYDITPIRKTTNPLSNNPVTVSNTSTTVTFSDTGHGAVEGDYVTVSGATATGGVPADELNAEHVITSIPDANSWTVSVTTAATSSTSGGGASVAAVYQVSIGLDVVVLGTGWGVDTFGSEGWGSPSTVASSVTGQLRQWSMVSYGEDLISNIRNGGIYTWDASSGVGSRAVNITTLAGASGTPTIARRIMLAAESRHLLALGCDPVDDTGNQDPLLIRWPDTEGLITWVEDTNNSAGSIRLSSGSEIITGLSSKRNILVWTDTSLVGLSYIGPPYFFGAALLSTNIGIMSARAAIEVDDVAYWMGKKNFYVYDGATKELSCTLRDDVFQNLNTLQSEKVFAASNSSNSEVTWFYPTTGDEVDTYITFNYAQNIWYGGTLDRTAWMDRSFNEYPIAASTDNKLYDHEKGVDDGSTTPVTAINSYIESSAFEPVPGDGYSFSFVRRIIHDMTFTGSETDNPVVTVSLTPKDYPGNNVGTTDSGTVTRTVSTPVEQYTKDSHMRIRGRSLVYRIENTTAGVRWRTGTPRLEVRPDGRR